MLRLAFVFCVLLAGCSNFEPLPLDEVKLLHELRSKSVDLPAIGLDQDEAVLIALVHNPILECWRRDHEIAAGLIISEGVLGNPEFRPALQNLYSRLGNPVTLALDLRLFPAVPGATEVKVARARASERRVLAEIEELEGNLAVETRIAHARLIMLTAKRLIVERAESLHSQVEVLVSKRVEAGAATRVELALVQMQREKMQNELQAIAAEHAAAEALLAEKLGLSPGVVVEVRSNKTRRSPLQLEQVPLEDLALVHRPDLRALKETYEESERQLELIHLSKSIWPRFLQAGLGGLTSETNLGVDAGIEIPLFDSGEADIAVAELRRTKARDAFRSKLQAVRYEIHQAVIDYRESERRAQFVDGRLGPRLQEVDRMLESAIESGTVDALDLVALEIQVLDARRESVQLAFDLESAEVKLRAVTGGGFPRP